MLPGRHGRDGAASLSGGHSLVTLSGYPVQHPVLMKTIAVLKALRNATSDFAAESVNRYAALEPGFLAVGRVLQKNKLTNTVYRRSVETLVDRLRHGEHRHRTVRIGDLTFEYDVTDFTAGPLYFNDHPYEPETTQFLLDTLRAGDTFVDVGAHGGYFSVIAAKRVSSTGRVFAFEPNPAMYAVLQEHVRLNGIGDRVVSSELAISDVDDGTVTLFVSNCETNTGLSSLIAAPAQLEAGSLSLERTVQVKTRTIDTWMRSAGLARPIDVMKIDVEGAESQVLAGMKETLATRPPRRIIFEAERGAPLPPALVERGYETRLLDTYGGRENILFSLPRERSIAP